MLCRSAYGHRLVTVCNTTAKEETMAEAPPQAIVRSLVPARIDRLPWSRFHTRKILALGVAWVLEKQKNQNTNNNKPDQQHTNTQQHNTQKDDNTATIYLIGEVVGALVF